MLTTLVRQRISELDGEMAAAGAGEHAIAALTEELEEFKAKEEASYAIVDKYMDKLSRELPKVLDHEVEKLLTHAKREISSVNKWVDVHQCTAYIYGHALPFGTAGAVREVESYLHTMFDRMDKELSEMANLAVRHLNDSAQTVENPELGQLLANLGLRIGQYAARSTASMVTKSMGGVGGTAAGVGNIVKMGVKQVGKLFGKTFGKEVYKNIGKIFTKKMVQAMSVCLQVVTDLAFFAWDACHWQEELKQKVDQTVAKWRGEILGQFKGGMVESYRKTNMDTVRDCYAALRREIEVEIANARRTYTESDIRLLHEDRDKLISIIEKQGE